MAFPVLENLPLGICLLNSNWTVVFWNSRIERLSSVNQSEIVGKDIRDVFPQFRSEYIQFQIASLMAGQISSAVFSPLLHGSLFTRDEAQAYHAVTIATFDELPDEETGLVISVDDLTPMYNRTKKLMAANQALQLAERKRDELIVALTQSNDELDSFSHVVAHDLKQPLRGISLNADILREDHAEQLDQTGIDRLNRLQFLSIRMSRLIDDLLHYSVLSRIDTEFSAVDFNAMIEDIELTMEEYLDQNNAVIQIDALLPTYACDRVRMTELLRNLIVNGVKYNTSDKKIIQIGCDTSQTPAVFYVRDNGVGIDPKSHDEVFKIFNRLKPDRGMKVDGTGAGLTFVKKIIERHGGRIWIESSEGAGSTFYFTLEASSG